MPTLLFSGLLLAATTGMMALHVRTWRRARQAAVDADARETEYRRRQFRRRVQTTAMLALLAMMVLVGQWWVMFPRVGVTVFSVYWACAVLLAIWVALLALVDMIATRHHYGRIRNRYLAERLKLEAELRQALAALKDAKTPPPRNDSGDDEM